MNKKYFLKALLVPVLFLPTFGLFGMKTESSSEPCTETLKKIREALVNPIKIEGKDFFVQGYSRENTEIKMAMKKMFSEDPHGKTMLMGNYLPEPFLFLNDNSNELSTSDIAQMRDEAISFLNKEYPVAEDDPNKEHLYSLFNAKKHGWKNKIAKALSKYKTKNIRKYHLDDTVKIAIINRDGEVTGKATIYENEDNSMGMMLLIDKKCRNEKLAANLCMTLAKILVEIYPGAIVRSDVWSNNESSLYFHKKIGFKRVREEFASSVEFIDGEYWEFACAPNKVTLINFALKLSDFLAN